LSVAIDLQNVLICRLSFIYYVEDYIFYEEENEKLTT